MEKKEGKMRIARLKKQVVFNIIVIALFVTLLNFGISSYPGKGMQTRNNEIRFSWFGLASYAMVDDNPEFTSPIMVGKNKAIELEPGTYYWCVPFFNTCLQKKSFVIESEVSLIGRKIEAGEENITYLIENTGNTAAEIQIKNIIGRLITGLFILEPHANKAVELNETARIIATQK